MEGGKQANLSALYPLAEQLGASLPRRWHSGSKDKNLNLSNKNLCVQYGNAKSKDASTVRADSSIPSSCGVYYFEIRILDKGRDGYIGIGLNRGATFKNNRLPGWDKDSYGYHGDDGNAFLSNTSGVPFGPQFGTGDTVGCGVNFAEKCIFFTLNGLFLGAPFTDIVMNNAFYPVVGLQSLNETVEANFGFQPFVYDFQSYLSEARERTRTRVWKQPLPWKHGEWTRTLDSLVCSYLVHHGYSSTAESLAKSARLQLPEPQEQTRQRQRLLQLVLDGKLQAVIDELNQDYPQLLQQNPQLHFRLKCRQFIELVANCDLATAVPHAAAAAAANANANASNNSSMNNSNGNDVSMSDNGSGCEVAATATAAATTDPANDSTDELDQIFMLGRELHTLRVQHSLDTSSLNAAISLLAYENPQQSPMSHLLHTAQRAPLASELNSAILQSLQQPARPALEVALAQTARCLTALCRHSAEGGVAFVTDDHDWLQ